MNLEKEKYTNGQIIFEQKEELLTYFFKDGKVKAQGKSVNGQMQGEWKFYRATGQLWQIGNFRDNQKHGLWTRFDKNNQIEYQEVFEDGKKSK